MASSSPRDPAALLPMNDVPDDELAWTLKHIKTVQELLSKARSEGDRLYYTLCLRGWMQNLQYIERQSDDRQK